MPSVEIQGAHQKFYTYPVTCFNLLAMENS
ncbi:hypothetical protein A2U01_0084252, partial [Trifolium medium]|nr:hypothetical protein [Trifolium medium]